jgi:thioredoxin 1
MMTPIVNKVAMDLDIDVREVDVEEESNLAKEYGVVSVPTIVLFKEGEVVEIIVGAMPLHSFEKKVKESYGI